MYITVNTKNIDLNNILNTEMKILIINCNGGNVISLQYYFQRLFNTTSLINTSTWFDYYERGIAKREQRQE